MSIGQFHLERVKEDLLREITWVIANQVRDPRVSSMVTVTELRLAPDMRNATIFVSIMGEDADKKESIIGLNKAAPFIQKMAAARVRMKHFPKFYFKLDKTIDYSVHINDLFKEIKDDLV
jgi:ribosome-binding factor A